MTRYLNRIWAVVLLAFISCALWGSAFPMIKIGYEQFGITNSGAGAKILFAGVRFIIAGVLAWLAGSLAQKRPLLPEKGRRAADWRRVMLLSLFQTILQYFFFYLGLANCTGVKSSIINGSGAFVVIILTTLVFRMEKMTWKKLAGCILGFAGIILINLGGDMSGFAWNGEGFIFMTVLSYAGSTILIKRFTGEGADPVMMSSLQFVFGGIVLTLLGLLMGGASEQWSFTGAGFGTLMWLAFVSAAAYSLWAVLLKHNPVSRVAVFGFLNPVCGVLLSALLLGETEQAFSLRSAGALALVCLGIFIVNFERRTPEKQSD